MREARWIDVKKLFDRLVERPPETWAAALEEACDDPTVRADVLAMLEADQRPVSFLNEGVEDVAPRAVEEHLSASQRSGEQIGPYRLVEKIGHGGMGVVYRAARADGAYQQEVAIKLLPRFFESEVAITRFRSERQILASLQHPGIARLMDGGVTPEGTPYLVMEYVCGIPIDQYVVENQLSANDRLRLLHQVLQVVQYAHRNLVVHRDLKPSNILVTADGEVKLLDFGIAKLLSIDEANTQPLTQTGEWLLTPGYAAPEQLTGATVTTATDVYQIGILSYEVLTGNHPFDLHGKNSADIVQVVLGDDPPPASTVLRRTQRHTSTRALPADTSVPPYPAGHLRVELDTLLLKSLRKQPENRYASAEAFAADIDRYLHHRPIEARPRTAAYRVRKFITRNRSTLALAVISLLLVAGMTLYHLDRLSAERDAARLEATKAEAATEFLVDLFESNNPWRTGGDTVTAQDLLQRGEQRVHRLTDQPGVQATMLHAMGNAYRGLGRYEEADSVLQQAQQLFAAYAGPDDPAVGMTALSLAQVHLQGHHFGRALEQLAQAEAIFDAHQIDDDRRIALWRYQARALSNTERADSALALLQQAMAREGARGRTGASLSRDLRSELASVLAETGAVTEAETIYREVLAEQRDILAPDDPRLAATLNSLALLLSKHKEDPKAAEPYYREVLSISESTLGMAHPQTLTYRGNNLYSSLRRQGRYLEADSLRQVQLDAVRSHYDENHWRIGQALHSLGSLRLDRGDVASAVPLLREGVDVYRQKLGDDHTWTATASAILGYALARQGALAEAETLLHQASAVIDTADERATTTNLARGRSAINLGLGLIHLRRGAHERAEPFLTEAYAYESRSMNRLRADFSHDLLSELYEAVGTPEKMDALTVASAN